MGKGIAAIVGCLVLGFMLGRWTPAGELARAKAELKTMRRNQSAAVAPDTAAMAARGFLQIDPSERRRVPDRSSPQADPGPAAPAPEPAVTNEVDTADSAATNQADRAEDFAANMEQAKELWQVRSDLARNSFLQNIEADPEQTLQFDVLVEAMNIRLQSTVETWVDQHRNDEIIRAEEGARLLHDLTGALVLTYDEMDRTLPETWRTQSGSDFKLFDFIDPGVADSLIEVEDRMQNLEP